MSMGDSIGFSFTDTPELLDDGYGMMNLAMTALANALRSPLDLDRETGLIMPPFDRLRQDAKASLIVTHLEGDDLVARMQGDKSMLVNLTGVAGTIGGTAGPVAVAALGTGVMMPALTEARENARLMKSKAQLREVAMAVQIYAADNRDELPNDLDTLIEQGLIPPDILSSPVGTVFDDGGDYWFNLDHVDVLSEIEHPGRMILGYDRASYVHGDQVNAVFFDGHVETMPRWKFDDLITQPQHEGIDFNVPDTW
jgi:prepilin-type processing-associated H-X9-DG protein